MPKPVSVKHSQIDQARSNTTIVVTVAVVIVVFSLMSSKALLSQAAYQRRVINARHAGAQQLQKNVQNAQQLVTQYNQVFEGSNPVNIIGGQNDKSTNATPPNGDNARIVLDALPSKYDYPALLSSVNAILTKHGASSTSITGDDNSASTDDAGIANPQPIAMQLTINGSASYDNFQQIIHDFETSIRPFDITSMRLNGNNTQMTFTLTVTTYYQQPKSVDLVTKRIQ